MIDSLPADLVDEVLELGQAVDIGRPISVFDGGWVGFSDVDDEVNDNGKREGAGGPAAGPRQGPQAWPRGAAGEAGHPFGRVWPNWLIEIGVEPLIDCYPGTSVYLEPGGCWIKVPMRPLGAKGPAALLVVALATRRDVQPRCWAYFVDGPAVRWVGPRHTNYPHGDACAFPHFEGHWSWADGLTKYADIHAEWLLRHLFLATAGRWPGAQMSPFPLYAISQFKPTEHCHCGGGRRYGECCAAADLAEVEADRLVHFARALAFASGGWFNSQRPPDEIYQFAMGGAVPGLAISMRWFGDRVGAEARAPSYWTIDEWRKAVRRPIVNRRVWPPPSEAR